MGCWRRPKCEMTPPGTGRKNAGFPAEAIPGQAACAALANPASARPTNTDAVFCAAPMRSPVAIWDAFGGVFVAVSAAI
jgi:hypothetical protein